MESLKVARVYAQEKDLDSPTVTSSPIGDSRGGRPTALAGRAGSLEVGKTLTCS